MHSSQKQTRRLALEYLETREAPATLVNATTLTYQDIDGDHVVVKVSKPIFQSTTVNNVFVFSSGFGAVNGNNNTPQSLQRINLSAALASHPEGTNLSLIATRSLATGGDGYANVGLINGIDLDLGTLRIDGDLGAFWAGDADVSTMGVAALHVQSMGRFGLSTQTPGGTLQSHVFGRLGTLHVKGDVVNASVEVDGGSAASLGKVFIGGSLMGANSQTGSGEIAVDGNIGSIVVKRNVAGFAVDSGRILSSGFIGNVYVGGSLLSGPGKLSGSIFGLEGIGSVRIGHDVVGGVGLGSGTIAGDGAVGRIIVRGSVLGGAGENSGTITSATQLGPVTISGDVRGSGTNAGSILSGGDLKGVKVGGSVFSGNGFFSGSIRAQRNIGSIAIAGSVIGDSFNRVSITAGGMTIPPPNQKCIASINIGGSSVWADIRAGFDLSNNQVVDDVTIGPVRIGGDFVTSNLVAGCTAGDDLVFGTDDDELIGGLGNIPARIVSVSINGQILGTPGGSDHYGIVAQQIGSVKIGGSVIPLTNGASNDDVVLGSTFDVNLIEVSIPGY